MKRVQALMQSAFIALLCAVVVIFFIFLFFIFLFYLYIYIVLWHFDLYLYSAIGALLILQGTHGQCDTSYQAHQSAVLEYFI